jgi:mono/diheme cytochrome c family protein
MRSLISLLAVVLFLFAGVTLVGCDRPAGERKVTAITPDSKGHQLFLTHCVACHMGATDSSAPNANLLSSDSLKSEDAFKELLRHPRSATMPAFDEKTLNEEAVSELYTYLINERDK